MTDEQAQERARKGGFGRAEALSAQRREEIARTAATARWSREDHFDDDAARTMLQRLRSA